MDPPLLLALDEIGNLSPLPSLPVLMAEGGGTGITTMPVLQSLSQARDKWGDHAAGAIWDASIVKVVFGGTSSAKDLQDLSALIGERDEKTDTVSVGDYGSRSLQQSIRRVPVMPPEVIRTLPFGTALVLLRSARGPTAWFGVICSGGCGIASGGMFRCLCRIRGSSALMLSGLC
jgi:type IV secretion system protein VirD4